MGRSRRRRRRRSRRRRPRRRRKRRRRRPRRRRRKRRRRRRSPSTRAASGRRASTRARRRRRPVRRSAAQKKKGIGLFATKTLSADLAAICGKNKMARPEVVKSLWVYIKKNKLSKGRTITPDAKLKKVLPAASVSMFKMAGMLSKHIK